MKFLKIFLFIASTTLNAAWSATTLSGMTLDEKIGQFFMVAAISNEHSLYSYAFRAQSPYTLHKTHIEQLIKNYHIGGIIFLGRSTKAEQISYTKHFQHLSSIPLLIGLDAEWGLHMRLDDGQKFPKAGELGTINNHKYTYEIGYEIGKQLKALGVHINFAPVIDVNNNDKNPIIGPRSFGADPYVVAEHGIFFAQGLQDAGIIACGKHFPGHGNTTVDSHLDLPTIPFSREELERIELYSFRQFVDENARMIMVGHLHVPALDATPHLPASLSRKIVTDLLKGKSNINGLGFNGLVITDALGMQALTNYYQPGEIELKALLAGNDILLCPLDVPKAVLLIKQALADGTLPIEELDEHVLKILALKHELGLIS